jgi:hypothetical protein
MTELQPGPSGAPDRDSAPEQVNQTGEVGVVRM